MVNETKEKEIWKQYPKYSWIEVSNLGRVRTKDHWVTYKDGRKRLFKGKVLKQHLQKNGYVYVSTRGNGKDIHLLVHRAVAICFLPNPNNLPEVNHIDNNPKNNRLDNLEWCSRKYNEDYKKKFGTSPAEVLGRPVFAVNLETGRVFYFKSQCEAARQLGISQQSVSAVIKGRLNQADGYWFTEDESEITEEKIREVKSNMRFLGGVIVINTDTFEVFYFESQSEAARQLGISVGSVNDVLKGRYYKTYGCWFCYADDTTVEKTRSKFGDKITKEVEKLMSNIKDA